MGHFTLLEEASNCGTRCLQRTFKHPLSRGVGFSGRRRVHVCWNSFQQYSRLVAQSRRFGDVLTPNESIQGERHGRRAGLRTVRFVERRMRRAE